MNRTVRLSQRTLRPSGQRATVQQRRRQWLRRLLHSSAPAYYCPAAKARLGRRIWRPTAQMFADAATRPLQTGPLQCNAGAAHANTALVAGPRRTSLASESALGSSLPALGTNRLPALSTKAAARALLLAAGGASRVTTGDSIGLERVRRRSQGSRSLCSRSIGATTQLGLRRPSGVAERVSLSRRQLSQMVALKSAATRNSGELCCGRALSQCAPGPRARAAARRRRHFAVQWTLAAPRRRMRASEQHALQAALASATNAPEQQLIRKRCLCAPRALGAANWTRFASSSLCRCADHLIHSAARNASSQSLGQTSRLRAAPLEFKTLRTSAQPTPDRTIPRTSSRRSSNLRAMHCTKQALQ